MLSIIQISTSPLQNQVSTRPPRRCNLTPSFIIKGRFSLKPVAHWPVLFVNEVKSSWLRRGRDSIDRVLSQVSWKSCVIHEALAFRRWVPQSRMEMASVVDPRIPKNMSSENEPCLIHLYPWKPSAQTHCKRPGPSDAQDPFSGHISGLPVLLQRSFCPWQICLSMKEVTLSQALIPPGQWTSCGSIRVCS